MYTTIIANWSYSLKEQLVGSVRLVLHATFALLYLAIGERMTFESQPHGDAQVPTEIQADEEHREKARFRLTSEDDGSCESTYWVVDEGAEEQQQWGEHGSSTWPSANKLLAYW